MSTESNAQPEERKQELSVPEIHARYKGRWVAVVVTKRDRNLQPIGGKVVSDDLDRYRLREHLSAYPDVCIFYAGGSLYPLLL